MNACGHLLYAGRGSRAPECANPLDALGIVDASRLRAAWRIGLVSALLALGGLLILPGCSSPEPYPAWEDDALLEGDEGLDAPRPPLPYTVFVETMEVVDLADKTEPLSASGAPGEGGAEDDSALDGGGALRADRSQVPASESQI